MTTQEPNLFELRRGAIRLTFSANGIDGRPRLNFDDGERQLEFAGDQLQIVDTGVGRLLTVELSFNPDGDTRLLSLLLPQVHLPADRPDVRVKVLVIATAVRSSIGGPGLVQGQVQTSSARLYRGTARIVSF